MVAAAAPGTARALAAEMAQLLATAERVDQAEDARYGKGRRGDELPEELARRDSRLRKIREAKAALEAEAAATSSLLPRVGALRGRPRRHGWWRRRPCLAARTGGRRAPPRRPIRNGRLAPAPPSGARRHDEHQQGHDRAGTAAGPAAAAPLEVVRAT